MKKRCFIFGALAVNNIDERPNENDIVIAADKGIENVERLGLRCDIIVGDFDSLGHEPCVTNTDTRLIKLNVRKDDTDVGHAINLALEMGCDEFILYGALGGKLDHTLANIQIAAGVANSGKLCTLVGDSETVYVFKNSSITLEKEQGRFSVFALTEAARRVDIIDAEYLLDKYDMTNTFPIGVSNEFKGKPVTVSVQDGILAVIVTTV